MESTFEPIANITEPDADPDVASRAGIDKASDPAGSITSFPYGIAVSLLHRQVGTSDGPLLGGDESSPCPPLQHPPVRSSSFWAVIPAGRTLHAGENVFTYYTTKGEVPRVDVAIPVPTNLYFSFHVTKDGGLKVPFQWSGRVRTTRLFHYDTVTYDVSLYVASNFRLTSDLVFFLQTGQTVRYLTAL